MAADPLARWPKFAANCRTRLDHGREAYGDRSFAAHPTELCREIAEELEDVSAWAFVLWVRVQRLREALADGERGEKP
jgi:hypothetical protein